MALCVELFDKEHIDIPILIGGAAVNKEFASRISVLEGNRTYKGGVFYAKDAFEASKILDEINLRKQSNGSDNFETGKNSTKNEQFAANNESGCDPLEYGPHIEPPFWGTSEVLIWDAEALLNKLNTERLFKAWWGGGKLNDTEYAHARETQFEVAFAQLKEEILTKGLIDARGFYGYFPVITIEEKMIIINPDDFHSELAVFHFPRMPKSKRSIADFLCADGDLLGVQIVTIGAKLGQRCREYFKNEDKYSYGFFLNALGNMIVEELAEKVTVEMRRGLGLENASGKRYSFGYPALPTLEAQKQLFDIMVVEDRLGITLTEGFQMEPEHSTLGIFVHHPKAEFLS